jgi:hypothetical protein
MSALPLGLCQVSAAKFSRIREFGTLLKENGADMKLIQSLMRHSNVSVTADRYVQSTTSAKREAQLSISSRLQQTVPKLYPDCAVGPLNY